VGTGKLEAMGRPNILARFKRDEALLALLESEIKPNPGALRPIWPSAIGAVYVSNVGSDDNDGLSPAFPWRTTQHLQSVVNGYEFRSMLDIHEMTDEATPVYPLSLNILTTGAGQVNLHGTPQVEAAGTFTAVQAMVPASQTRFVVTDSSKPSGFFDPFADGTHWVVVSAGPRLGNQAPIVLSDGVHSATLGPCIAPDGTQGTFHVGDAYQVVRGSKLTLGTFNPQSTTGGVGTQLFDFDFQAAVWADEADSAAIRCSGASWVGPQTPAMINCLVGTPDLAATAIGTDGLAQVSSGVYWSVRGADFAGAGLILSSDVYVTGAGIVISPSRFTFCAVVGGNGAGAQFQDMQNVAISIQGTDNDFTQAGLGLLWGNGNIGALQIALGVTASVPSGNSSAPTVTGFLEIVFIQPTGSAASLARTFNTSTGQYSAGLVDINWAAFASTFGSHAHLPESGSNLVGIGGGI